MKTHEAARGRWRDILPLIGIESRFLNGRHHPCPCTGEGVDPFRFSDRNGSGNYFCRCSPDGKAGGIELVKCKTGAEFAAACAQVDQLIGNTHNTTEMPNRADPLPLLRQVQSRARRGGAHVRKYLEGRGLIVPPGLLQVDQFEYIDADSGRIAGHYDAMVARVVDKGGVPQSWHVTWLSGGQKSLVRPCRKVLPPVKSIKGCAVRLFPAEEHMGVAEGIESAISAYLLTGVPTWAALSRNGLTSFEPPDECKHLTIYGDNDKNFVGQAGAYATAERLSRKPGLRVDVQIPAKAGYDWNDVLMPPPLE